MLHVACSVGATVRAARCRAILARGMPYGCRLLFDRPECVDTSSSARMSMPPFPFLKSASCTRWTAGKPPGVVCVCDAYARAHVLACVFAGVFTCLHVCAASPLFVFMLLRMQRTTAGMPHSPQRSGRQTACTLHVHAACMQRTTCPHTAQYSAFSMQRVRFI